MMQLLEICFLLRQTWKINQEVVYKLGQRNMIQEVKWDYHIRRTLYLSSFYYYVNCMTNHFIYVSSCYSSIITTLLLFLKLHSLAVCKNFLRKCLLPFNSNTHAGIQSLCYCYEYIILFSNKESCFFLFH